MAEQEQSEAQGKGLNKSTRVLVWTIGLGGGLLLAGGVGAFMLAADGFDLPSAQSAGESGGWYKLELAGALPDGPQPGGFVVDPAEMPATVHSLSASLLAAAEDPEVNGVLLELDGPALGYAGALELHNALATLQEAGKPCRAWSKTYDNISWLVASACEEVHLHPEGVPMVIGLSVNTTYYAGLFEELGVSPDFERVGTYKSAIETYENTGPSEPTVEMYDALLDSLFATYTQTVADSRGVGVEAVAGLIQDPPITAKAAQARGLVDQLTYRDDWLESIGEDLEPADFSEYMKAQRTEWSKGKKKVAVLHLQGSIIDGESNPPGLFSSGSNIGDATVVPILEELAEDEDIVAVVLRIDSPGGSALASDVMWHAIEELDEKKPVVASMGGYAASGGYYIAMGTRHIVAQPGTLTGSIGVFGGKFALGGLYEKVGITTWSSKRGDLAGLYNITEPFTDAERAKIRTRIEAFYDTFVTKAADSRGMTWDELDAVAGGRVWTGAQAVEIGLVDELGGLDRAIEVALEEAGVSEDEVIGRKILPRQQTLMEALLEGLSTGQVSAGEEFARQDAEALKTLLGPQLSAAMAQAELLTHISEHGGGLVAMDPVLLSIE